MNHVVRTLRPRVAAMTDTPEPLREQLEELQRLLAGASEAPWEWLDSEGDPDGDELQDGRGEMVANNFRDDVLSDITDGRLCAALRNAAPALLKATAEFVEQQERVAVLEMGVLQVAQMHGECPCWESPCDCPCHLTGNAHQANGNAGSDLSSHAALLSNASAPEGPR